MKLPRPVWSSPQSREHDQLARRHRIVVLERELGIVPGPEGELTPLNEKLQALCKRRDELQAATRSSPEPAQRQQFADLDHEIREAIGQLSDSRDRLMAGAIERSGAGLHRHVHWDVTREGRNQWLLQVRSLDSATGSEKVREHRVTGWRNRKIMEELERATEARRRLETRPQ